MKMISGIVVAMMLSVSFLHAEITPVVTTADGATNIGVGTASLRAQLTAGVSADVFICWGADAGDTANTSTWENVVSMGPLSDGDIVTNDLSGLYYGIEYSYVVYATNSEGTNWSALDSFTTSEPVVPLTVPVVNGLSAHFDASVGITTDGSGVYTWNDQSENGVYATRSAGTLTLVEDEINGLPAVQFRSNPLADITGSLYSKQQYAVVRFMGGDWGALMGSTGTRSGYMMHNTGYFWSGNYPEAVRQNGGAELTPNYQLSDIAQYMVVRITGNNNDTSVRSGWGLARADGWQGIQMDLAELIVYDTTLSTSDEDLVGGYLSYKYGITTSYPNYSPPDPYAVAATSAKNIADTTATLQGTLDATQSVFTVYAAYSESNNTSVAEWEADDTKTLVLDAAYTNVMDQAISVTVGSLTPETTYYYTLVASNAVTNIWASPRVAFTTLASAVNPSVTTNDGAFAVGYTTASLRGEMTAGGNANIYICWGESAGNTTSTSSWANVDFMGTLADGAIVTNHLTELAYSTEHHYVVYATNDASTAWSSVASFTTDTPGDDRYATGTFTWSTGVNAWSFESGGPYDLPWEAGKNAILEGTGTTLSTVTLGENISLAHLKINTNNYRITGNTLNFAGGSTITNLGNSVHIISGITGEPDVYVSQPNGWTLSNPLGGSFGNDGFKLIPSSSPMKLGTIHRGTDNYFWLGGAAATNTVVNNPYPGNNRHDKTYVDGSGIWSVGSLYGGNPFQMYVGTLIANGEITCLYKLELEGGVLHLNDPDALGSNSKPLYIEGGDLDNSSGAPVASAYNFAMRWSSDWTFVGSQGADSDLNLGTGAVTMYADRTVTVANAAATLTVGGVVSADAGNPYSLTKAGPGTLVLTGNNTYTGDTTVDGGVLSISQPYLSSIASVRIASGATLDLSFSGTNDVFAVFTNGVAGPGGTWGSLASSADNKTAFITGAGILNVPQAEVLEGIRYWDGGTSDIEEDGNALSTGGGGTWNTLLKNWDAGAGVSHTNWNNAGTDLAYFKGTPGTVSVTESINLGALRIDNVDGYTIQGGTLNFAPGGSITNSSTSSGVNETKLTISSAITGAPDVQSALGPNTYMEFTPTAGSVELGALVGPGAYRFGGTTDGSAASVSTKLRVSGSGIWTVSSDVDAYEHWVGSGTLVVNGLLRGNNQGVHLSGGTVVVNGTTSGIGFDMTGGTIKGTGVMSGSALVVPAAGTIAPGYPTGTMTITNNNCTLAGTLAITMDDNTTPKVSSLAVDGALAP